MHHEFVSLDPGLPCRLIIHDGNGLENIILPHWHQEVEIDLVTWGYATYTINEQRLHAHAGTIVIVNANEIHSVNHITPNSQAITLLISYKFLQKQIPHFKHIWYNLSNKSIRRSGYQGLVNEIIKMKLINIQTDPTLRYLQMMTSLYRVIYLLQKYFSIYQSIPNNIHGTMRQQVIEQVIQYLTDHFRELLTLDDIAKVFHLSVGYLSRSFSRELGITLMRYLSLIRLKEAYRLLTETNKSIEAIVDLSGFPNAKSFRRTFVSVYSKTPLQYRHQFNQVKNCPFFGNDQALK